jgi:hypothetical protein
MNEIEDLVPEIKQEVVKHGVGMYEIILPNYPYDVTVERTAEYENGSEHELISWRGQADSAPEYATSGELKEALDEFGVEFGGEGDEQ